MLSASQPENFLSLTLLCSAFCLCKEEYEKTWQSMLQYNNFTYSSLLCTNCTYSMFYLCCYRPHCPGSLVLCVEGWMESCSSLMMFHQRYLGQNPHLQQHLCVTLQIHLMGKYFPSKKAYVQSMHCLHKAKLLVCVCC